MIMQNKRLIIIVLVAALLLLISLIAMQFTDQVNWTLFDFIVAGVLLIGTGLMCELVMRNVKKISTFILLAFLVLNCLAQECKSAADFIAEKYKKYNIITVDEGPHGTVQIHEFLRALLQNKKISGTIRYLIVEFANISYQPVLDRYINGEAVSIKELQPLWRETTQAHSTNIENRVYLQLLKTIRNINSKLPANKKIRVLAGDPPIDWSKVNSLKEYFSCLSQRDVLPSQLAIKYGIDSSKKVLLIYGGAHLGKISDEKRDSAHWTIPFLINKKHPNSVLTVGAFNSHDHKQEKFNADIPLNSICDLSISSLGKLSVKNEINPSAPLRLKDIFDAVYFLGPSDKWVQGQPLPIDSVYWKELNRRSIIVWGEGIDPKLRRDY